MDSLTSFSPRQVAPDTFVLPAFTPLPFGGVLPLHAFLIRGAEPVPPRFPPACIPAQDAAPDPVETRRLDRGPGGHFGLDTAIRVPIHRIIRVKYLLSAAIAGIITAHRAVNA
ncbi:MAG: hypothetical protein HOP14_13660 [Acidobacteria bacterium]|nr:hypothetical protein [Acidobacteriota bacterium]